MFCCSDEAASTAVSAACVDMTGGEPRYCSGEAAAGTADITVGAADARGVAAAGAALLAAAESPAGVTMGGGYSSSTGIL